MEFKKKTEVYRNYNREVLHGIGGSGKSTGLGAISKRPLVVDFDHRWPSEYVEKADFPKFEETFEGTIKLLNDILSEASLSNDRIVFDTITKLLSLIEDYVLAHDCNGSREKYNAYGHGIKFLRQYFKQITDLVDQIQAKHRITVTFICHSKMKDQRNVNSEIYQKNCLDLPEGISELLKQWADYVGYIWFDVSVDASRKKATGEVARLISFNENPSYEAKNSSRFVLPTKINYDKEGEWAQVVFGQTQDLLKELDTLVAKLPDGDKKQAIIKSIDEQGVRSLGVTKLKQFIEAGRKAIG